MPMPARVINPVVLHTAVTLSQRDYLNLLARYPDLTETKTVNELISRGVAVFLATEPYRQDGWTWIRPPGYYYYIDGVRHKNEGWVAFHPKLGDFTDSSGNVVSSATLHQGVLALAAIVPRQHGKDFGVSAVLHTIIEWLCTDLYPPKRYGVRSTSTPVEVQAAEVKVKSTKSKAIKGEQTVTKAAPKKK